MDLDTFRQQARKFYHREYVAKTISFREKFFLYPAKALLTGGLWVAGAGLCALMLGVVAAAPVFAAGLVAVASSLPLLHTGSSLADRRAALALERDLDNGILVETFRRRMLSQPTTDASPAAKLGSLTASESFNSPVPVPHRIVMPPRVQPVLQPVAA